MITVRFPAVLRERPAPEVRVEEPVATLGDLLDLLDRRFPGLARGLDDPIFAWAINEELVLHDALARPLREGDVVEVVPAISGG